MGMIDELEKHYQENIKNEVKKNGYFELIEKADKINDLYSKDEILEVFDELESRLQDARNEPCEECGEYLDNHITHACDKRCYWGM